VFVVPASALAANPDFPHGDKNPENWRAVSVYNGGGVPCPEVAGSEAECEFDTPEANWNLTIVGHGVPNRYCRTNGFAGGFGVDGGIEVDAADFTAGGSGYQWCGGIYTSNLPWEGKMCAYVGGAGDPEFWARQDFKFDFDVTKPKSHHAEGESYGQFTTQYPGEEFFIADGLTFGAKSPTYLFKNPWSGNSILHQLTLDLSASAPTLYLAGNEPGGSEEAAPCAWPELS
jgi:hypothetical protein